MILYLMIGIVVLTIFLLCADIFHFLPWANQTSERYDWLSFIGAVIGGVATLVLGYVTLRQNENQGQQLEEERKKNETLVRQATQAPKISFMERQVFIDKKNLLAINIHNENELLLDDIKFHSINLVELEDQWHDYNNKEEHTKKILKGSSVVIPFEYTRTTNNEIWSVSAPIKNETGALFENGKFYRLEFDMTIKNQANIICKGMFYILVKRGSQSEDEKKHDHIPLSVYWQYSRNIKVSTITK